MSRPFRATLAIVAIALSSGCIALIHDDASGAGAHCRFSGDDNTACGSCLAQYCQAAIDNCCNPDDYNCSFELEDVESCTKRGDCSSLEATGDAGSPSMQIKVCATANCNGPCAISTTLDGGRDSGRGDAGTACVDSFEVTTCGTCAAQSCSAFLTAACCNDQACAGTLYSFKQCTARRDCSCTSLYYDKTPYDLDTELRQCLSSSCNIECINPGCP